jgi:hypothetical protein
MAAACSPDVDVYAPERELYVVYGVLDKAAALQYVTVTKVFQYEGDAYAYAAATDLTARGLRVRLLADSTAWEGQLVDLQDTLSNLFSNSTGAYRFETSGGQALQSGKRYDLEITKPDNTDFLITAYTVIPTQPIIKAPGNPIYSASLGLYSYPTMEFADEQMIYFERGSGSGFEVRVYVEYHAGAKTHIARWGPTAVFKAAVGCNVDTKDGCYKIPRGSVPNVLHSIFSTYPDTVTVIDTLRRAYTLDSLDKTAWVEVTAIDSFLTNYMIANSPFGFGINLLMDKAEYSNISGDNAGVFGSIRVRKQYIFLDACTKYLSGLRGRKPGNCPP